MKKILIILLALLVALFFVACPPPKDGGDGGDGGTVTTYYTVSVSIDPADAETAGASVAITPADADADTAGHQVEEGSSVTFTATNSPVDASNTQYIFSQWSDGTTDKALTISNVTADVSETATFTSVTLQEVMFDDFETSYFGENWYNGEIMTEAAEITTDDAYDSSTYSAKFNDLGSGLFGRYYSTKYLKVKVETDGDAVISLFGKTVNPSDGLFGFFDMVQDEGYVTGDFSDYTDWTEYSYSLVPTGEFCEYLFAFIGSSYGDGDYGLLDNVKILSSDPSKVEVYVAQPQIQVEYDGASIEDAETFTTTGVNGDVIDLVFNVNNLGDGTLTFTDTPIVTIGGADVSDFTLTDIEGVIESGGSGSFTLSIDTSTFSGTSDKIIDIAINNNTPADVPEAGDTLSDFAFTLNLHLEDTVVYILNDTVDGSGTITKDPDLPYYPENTVVTLTPTPDASNEFIGWAGNNSADISSTAVDGEYEINMDSNKAIEAVFLEYTTLTVDEGSFTDGEISEAEPMDLWQVTTTADTQYKIEVDDAGYEGNYGSGNYTGNVTTIALNETLEKVYFNEFDLYGEDASVFRADETTVYILVQRSNLDGNYGIRIDTTTTDLTAPQNFTATANGAAVDLDWEAPATGTPAIYRIYRSGDVAGPFMLIHETTDDQLDPAAVEYSDTTGAPSVAMYYYVVAVDAVGVEGAASTTENAANTVTSTTLPLGTWVQDDLSDGVSWYDVAVTDGVEYILESSDSYWSHPDNPGAATLDNKVGAYKSDGTSYSYIEPAGSSGQQDLTDSNQFIKFVAEGTLSFVQVTPYSTGSGTSWIRVMELLPPDPTSIDTTTGAVGDTLSNVQITGTNLPSDAGNASVRLVDNSDPGNVIPLTVNAAGATLLLVDIDLTGATAATYNLVVTNTATSLTGTITDAFEVTAATDTTPPVPSVGSGDATQLTITFDEALYSDASGTAITDGADMLGYITYTASGSGTVDAVSYVASSNSIVVYFSTNNAEASDTVQLASTGLFDAAGNEYTAGDTYTFDGSAWN